MKCTLIKRCLAGILSISLIVSHSSFAFTTNHNLYSEHIKRLVLSKSYDFNEDGNVSVIKHNDMPKIWYFYDDRKQLVRENNSFQNETIIYSYDSRGNILSKNIYDFTCTDIQDTTPKKCIEYKYDDEDQLIYYDGKKITYDRSGNIVKYRDDWSLKWRNGLLSEISNPKSKITYKYNADGERVSKCVNDMRFDFDFSQNKFSQKTADHVIKWYSPGEKGSKSFNCDGKDYTYVCNLESDVIAIIDEDNNCVANYIYDSWGNIVSITDQNGCDVTDDMNHIGNINPLRYRGYYYDVETGLYYLHARYYDPVIGRFLSKDDEQYLATDSPNPYAYCNNNPVNMVDFDGHEVLTLSLLLVSTDAAVKAAAAAIAAAMVVAAAANPMIRSTVDAAINWAVNSFVTAGAVILAKFKQLGQHIANLIGQLVVQYDLYLTKQKIPSSIKTPDGRVDLSKFDTPSEIKKGGRGRKPSKGPSGWEIRAVPGTPHKGDKWKLYCRDVRIASLKPDGTIVGK